MGLSIVLVLFLIIGMMLPEKLHVERNVKIKATPQQIYIYVASFRKFNQWSPWAAIDPATKYKFVGPEQGNGAIMHWKSEHPSVGAGSQKIIEAAEYSRVKSVLAMGNLGKAYSIFDLKPEGEFTTVTWSFDMRFGYNIPGRIVGMGMGDGISHSYETGLQRLKRLIETGKPGK